jgi:cystathionine beta-lyase
MAAIAGAVATSPSMADVASSVAPEPMEGTFDFDTIYSRVGTDCIKWDGQIEKFGKENIEVGMGIADMDFRAAPCITKALAERCSHENWGYMTRPTSYAFTRPSLRR